jgi:hypothetical protein
VPGLRVTVGVLVGCGVAVGAGVSVGVAVGVSVGLGVGVDVSVDVGHGVNVGGRVDVWMTSGLGFIMAVAVRLSASIPGPAGVGSIENSVWRSRKSPTIRISSAGTAMLARRQPDRRRRGSSSISCGTSDSSTRMSLSIVLKDEAVKAISSNEPCA